MTTLPGPPTTPPAESGPDGVPAAPGGAPAPGPAAGAPPGIAAAGALAHPSRRRIADVLAESPDGLGVQEMAEAVGLHHNAVRQHLQRLSQAGVVSVVREAPRGRGRPRLRYRLVDVEAPRIAAHQELVRLLVTYLVRTGATPEDVEAFGREQGGFFATEGGATALVEGFSRLGFAPREAGTSADPARGRLEMRLGHCPFRDAVMAPGGEVICRLHRGLADGMARRAAPEGRLTELDAIDPARAGCRLVFEGMTTREGSHDD